MKKLSLAAIVAAFTLGASSVAFVGTTPAVAADMMTYDETDHCSCPLLWPICAVKYVLHIDH